MRLTQITIICKAYSWTIYIKRVYRRAAASKQGWTVKSLMGRIQLQPYGRYLSPSSLVMRPDAISHIREISGPMNLKVPRSVF